MAASKKHESLIEKALIFGSSLVYLGKGTADDVIDELEKRNILAGKKGKELAEEIREEAKNKRKKATKMVTDQLKKIIDEIGIATKADLKKLKK